MQIEVAKHARMSERGSSLLRLIQNHDLPLLDLLIREAVQNSLDAAKIDSKHVNIDIGTSEFKTTDLASKMEDITEPLLSRFSKEKYKCIYIADSNTTGLTGPLSIDEVIDDEYGNLLKLVYEISIPQSKDGAGGSWGLGKTIYFRLGMGLVFYYSRVKKTNGTYEHRLAATMVEDETKPEAMIPAVEGKPKRGIAWWGKRLNDSSTIPITDKYEIGNILSIFDIKPFEEDETGTKIIIPFIDEQFLLNNEMDEDYQRAWWDTSIEDYLHVAFQRWYAPRIDNTKYSYGSWLNASVNGKEIKFDSMQPVFKVIQSLYNAASNGADDKSINSYKIEIKDVSLRKDLKYQVAGKVAFSVLEKDDLLMFPPYNNADPFRYINIKNLSDIGNSPIITYVRKPGMIISYENSGLWCKDIPDTNSNEFLVGIFVPNSNNPIVSLEGIKDLEDYLRKSEKADHASWFDLNYDGKKTSIVTRIQRNTSKIISQNFVGDSTKEVKKRNNLLGRNLAKVLLPPQSFGKVASPSPGGRGGTTKPSPQRKAQIIFDRDITYEGNFMVLNFQLKLKKSVKNAKLELNVESESGFIKGDNWEDEKTIGTKFPVELERIVFYEVNGKRIDLDLNNSSNNPINLFSAEILTTKKYNVKNGMELSEINDDLDVKGKVFLTNNDRFVRATMLLNTN